MFGLVLCFSHPGATSGELGEPYGMPGVEPASVICKASALLILLSLEPQ